MDADRKYMGLDMNVHEAKNFTNYTVFSLWDTYRATHRAYGGLGYYMDLGFIPIEKEVEGASKVQEYDFDDWSLAQMAKKLGKEDDYREFMKRSGYWKNLFDAKTNFMQAKKEDGSKTQ